MTRSAADPALVVRRFNGFITERDLDGLTGMMSDDHVFVEVTVGAEPDPEPGTETVTVAGYSVCSVPALAGPALWTATVRDGQVARWQVLDDTPDNRRRLGL